MLIVFTVVIEKDGEDRNKEGEMHGKDSGNISHSGRGNVDDLIQRSYSGDGVGQTSTQ